METVQARWYTPATGRTLSHIVLHSMEAPDKPDTARSVGTFFAQLPSDRKASAHVGTDSSGRVRYVADKDVAYAAPGLNHCGLHVEQTGYARYTQGEWTQPQMMLMLQQTAQQVKGWADAYGIPLRYVTADELKRYEPHNLPRETWGVTTHWEVTKAWGQTDHHDPGPNYPIHTLLAMAQAPPVPWKADEMAPYIHVERNAGPGYWLVKPSDGGVFAYDGADFYGSMAGHPLQAPIVDAASTPSGNGYWLLGADGGVFAFGDATFTDSYAGHEEWKQGSRVFVGIQPNGAGYNLLSVELNSDGSLSDPPRIDKYDLSEARS